MGLVTTKNTTYWVWARLAMAGPDVATWPWLAMTLWIGPIFGIWALERYWMQVTKFGRVWLGLGHFGPWWPWVGHDLPCIVQFGWNLKYDHMASYWHHVAILVKIGHYVAMVPVYGHWAKMGQNISKTEHNLSKRCVFDTPTTKRDANSRYLLLLFELCVDS